MHLTNYTNLAVRGLPDAFTMPLLILHFIQQTREPLIYGSEQ
jgi:hypothetical protein